MASCYDCIHCGACSDAGDSGFSSLKEDVSECKHFKNKADFVEVKRGEWIKKFKYSHGYDDYYNTECSLCGYKAEKSGAGDKLSLDNFCPNCGADMRGEKSDL